ncbi:SHOCT domain-containing protein [Agromyces sp. GXS1127]|uniref:SHOCT domain-containing protein n=1 Tax=Agromyces sp. GXS1127 TaxID=3424181 RepID=UPI003D3203E9
MMWDYGYGFGGWWMWLPGIVFGGLVIAGIIVLIVLFVRSASGGRSGPSGSGGAYGAGAGAGPAGHPQGDTAKRILEERLARGEITPEQFRELSAVLDEGRRSGPA